MKTLKNPLMLFIAAFIWGIAFVMQSEAAEFMGPFTFNGIRFILGFLVLLPVIAIMDRTKRPEERPASFWKPDKSLLKYGIICGVILCGATNIQQFGIEITTVGKAGFITAFYIVLVPIGGLLFFKRRCPPVVWLGMVVALFGLYLLCIDGNLSVGLGDLLVFLCSLVFTMHIIAIDTFAPRVDCIRLSCIQFLVAGVLSLILMLIFERPAVAAIMPGWKFLLYAGVLSCGGAYTLQVLGQKNYNPTIACLILSLEAVISALGGWVFLNESLTGREIIGCVLVFAAVVMVQVIPVVAERRKGAGMRT